MFTYVSFFELTAEGREKLPEVPKFLEKIQVIVEKEHGTLDKWFAAFLESHPSDTLAIGQRVMTAYRQRIAAEETRRRQRSSRRRPRTHE